MSIDLLALEYEPLGGNGSIRVTAKLGDELLAAEKLDILRPKQRADFAKRLCADHPGIDATHLDAELLRIAAAVVTKPEPSAGDTSDPLANTPEPVKADALAMLRDPALIQRVVDDIAQLGVAGEKATVATIYLVGTSRLLDRPLAAIVQGLTASGKSFVVDTLARLFPPESVIHAHKMTPEALVHMKQGALEHRFIVGGERSRKQDDDTADATRALREMLSDGQLTKLVPMRQPDGTIQTVSIHQPGPIAYVESTTLQTILDEDRNRCIVLQTDETPEQTRRIIDLAASRKAGLDTSADIEAIIVRHHAVQRLLRRCTVTIPFAEKLGERFPAERTDARRSFGHLLSMIEAVALLHQYHRVVDPADGTVIAATADDYALAHKLLSGPFGRALGSGLSDAARRFGERLAEKFGDREFDAREAAKDEKVIGDLTTIRQYVRALTAAGILEMIAAHQGRTPAKYRVSLIPPEQRAGLPGVEEVFSRVAPGVSFLVKG